MLTPRDRLIVALDVPNAERALELVDKLKDRAGVFKIGKQLFVAEGPDLVREIVSRGNRVFLDLKFHDIPNTVASAVKSAAALGASMLTVHTSGGLKMLKAAVEAAAKSPHPPLILGVTVLTSLGDEDLQQIGIGGRVIDQVLRLAALARQAGCGGVVASPHEARAIRSDLGTGFAIVTPGVRPAGAAVGDQARVLTPAQAIEAGANYLVIGRPITEAIDPAQAAQSIVDEIAGVKITI